MIDKVKHIKLTEDEIDVENILTTCMVDFGGIKSIFFDSCKSDYDGKEVVSLEFEVCKEMALCEMKRLCLEMYNRWPLTGVVIIHRIGVVPVGATSLVIIAGCKQGPLAQEAQRFCISEMNTIVASWKKEVYSDGTTNRSENNVNAKNDSYKLFE